MKQKNKEIHTKSMIALCYIVDDYGKFKEILITQAGSVINCHCGQNTLGVLYLNDGDEGHY